MLAPPPPTPTAVSINCDQSLDHIALIANSPSVVDGHLEMAASGRHVSVQPPMRTTAPISTAPHDDTIPMAAPPPAAQQSRLMRNRNRNNTECDSSTNQLTNRPNRPIIVYGIRVPDNDPELAAIIKYVAKLALVIGILQLVMFILRMANLSLSEELGSGGTEIPIYTGVFSLVVFGFCVPLFGYYGANKQDVNSLTLFCFGEGAIAIFGGCEFVIVLISVINYIHFCTTDKCVEEFKNSSDTECGEPNTSNGIVVQKAMCDTVLEDPYFWCMLTVSFLIVVAACTATEQTITMRHKMLEMHDTPSGTNNRENTSCVHVVPVGGVVATTTEIRQGVQHYQSPVTRTARDNSDAPEDIPTARPFLNSDI